MVSFTWVYLTNGPAAGRMYRVDERWVHQLYVLDPRRPAAIITAEDDGFPPAPPPPLVYRPIMPEQRRLRLLAEFTLKPGTAENIYLTDLPGAEWANCLDMELV